MLKIIRNFLNGLAFGITETIPGVSGGTIAIILGFYFELIEAINHFTENTRKYLKLLAPLALGMIAGIVLFSSVINFLLTNYSFPTMLFFIGLITGIIPPIFNKVKERGIRLKIREVILVVIPFALLALLAYLKKDIPVVKPEELIQNITIPYMIFIFISGILAAAALVIPGISGSFVLLLLSVYPLAIYCIKSIGVYLSDVHNTVLLLNICKVLGPLAIGVIAGGLCMTRIIEKLLKNYHKILYSIILGLLSGSVYFLFRDPMVYQSGINLLIIIIGIVTFLLGCALAFILGKKKI